MRPLALEEFGELFDTFRVNAFRLETFQAYDSPGEAEELQRWLAGEPLAEWSPETSPWLRRIAETTAAGKMWSRVRVVTHPLTDYTQFELACFAAGNLPAGEQVRVAVRDRCPLSEDWWGFDLDGPDAAAALMRYSPEGTFLGADFTDDPAAISRCRRERNLAIDASVPLLDYLTAAHA